MLPPISFQNLDTKFKSGSPIKHQEAKLLRQQKITRANLFHNKNSDIDDEVYEKDKILKELDYLLKHPEKAESFLPPIKHKSSRPHSAASVFLNDIKQTEKGIYKDLAYLDKQKGGKKRSAKRSAKRSTKKHSTKKRSTKKRASAKKRSTKKRSTKKRSTKKRSTKKRSTKKRRVSAKKRSTKKRSTKKRRVSAKKRSTKKRSTKKRKRSTKKRSTKKRSTKKRSTKK